jgi:copper chaperone NosL
MARDVRIALLVLVLALGAACGRSEGPVPVVFDRTPCAHCGMLVSDPRFAAQLHTADGEVLDFDDPGCLFAWRAAHPGEPHGVWYHHVREDRWLGEAEVAFIAVDESPMGFGIGAVELGAAGAFGRAEAQERVQRRISGGGHGP